MAHSSRTAVLTAIVSNAIVTLIKFGAALISGSAAMMNEAVHSLMDTLNQGFLLIGLREGERPADQLYAFGHGQKKYLWNLWSAIGLFSIGSGLGLAHAWHSWHDLGQATAATPFTFAGWQLDPLWINLAVLGIALLLEGFSFLVAFRTFLDKMRRAGLSNPLRFLLQADDPTLVAVVLEDSVAMLGLAFAALGVGLSAISGNALWDVSFSALIAIMLGMIAFYLGYTNMRFLADMRDNEAEALFLEIVAAHHQVERCHDLRSIIIDEAHTILVAEVELREEAVVPGLHERIQIEQEAILNQLPSKRRDDAKLHCYAAARAAVIVSLKRTEEIIDELEAAIKTRLPRVSHITLEVEGISQPADLPSESPP
ncbi:cation diffusion facilitator family transporter [Sedimenticola sp.]|uniref:cation diffusion facilitator family transporter n=1 Tax=Sedimenticola sp. TaxID=1940285 RepID=UPI003D09E1B2